MGEGNRKSPLANKKNDAQKLFPCDVMVLEECAHLLSTDFENFPKSIHRGGAKALAVLSERKLNFFEFCETSKRLISGKWLSVYLLRF